MAETPADVRRDIELTRERMSSTLAQLEQKVNVVQLVKDHPWPAVGLAVAAGYMLSGSRADVKAAAATVVATRGASSRIGAVLDDLVANLMTAATVALQQRVEGFATEIKQAIGAPVGNAAGNGAGGQQAYGTSSGLSSTDAGGSTAGGGWQPTRAD